MNNILGLSADDHISPEHIFRIGGITYLYGYSMVPARLLAHHSYRYLPLHVFVPEDVSLNLSHDFPFLIIGGFGNRAYTFPSWQSFQQSPVIALTADWTEMLLD